MATFSIQFYTIDCPPNTLNKGDPGENINAYQCDPLTWIDGLHATVSLDFTKAIEGANYCKISTESRTLYCYKRDFSLGTAGRMTVSLELDPLMTNKTQIRSCGIISRRTSQTGQFLDENPLYGYNAFLEDNKRPILQTTTTYDIQIPNAILGKYDNGSYIWNPRPILVTGG